MYQKMMDKEFGIKAITFIFLVSKELIKKLGLTDTLVTS